MMQQMTILYRHQCWNATKVLKTLIPPLSKYDSIALFPLGSLWIKDAPLFKRIKDISRLFFAKETCKGVKKYADFTLTSAPFWISNSAISTWNCWITNSERCRCQCKICRWFYSFACFFWKEQPWNVFDAFEKRRIFDSQRYKRKQCHGIIIEKQRNWSLQDFCYVSKLMFIRYCHMWNYWPLTDLNKPFYKCLFVSFQFISLLWNNSIGQFHQYILGQTTQK